MAITFTSESELEQNLINQLISGDSQWTYRKDLNTEEKLWVNLREKLERNNKDVLNGVNLTEQEFRQVQNQLTFANFYDAAKWLAGENGVAKVQVQREDASLGTIRLKVLNRADIAGGMSSYEVINQFQSFKQSADDRDRRFDVTLLINGLPLIHIELKNRAHSYMDAFRQIKKYLIQGKFNGIFSALQMFIVSNGSDTRYIAAAQDTKLNEQFLSTWVDSKNDPVTSYLDFAEHVLSIPQAHKMVTQYTVIDSDKKALILLRPYQIHAIEAIKQASKRQESGYVWHTTGSGKTLTSYKAARNLLQIPSLDKTIFIVDRVDLDQQTTSSFTSYAENDVVQIDETDNVSDLIKKLLSADRSVIVTTIQKLNHVMKRFEGKESTPRYKKLKHLHVAFVVDECHRAVSPQKKKEIEKFFYQSLWYGFTGTPIFAENAKQALGNLARTTEEQYGSRLHEYTVKEAIHDKAVLGFQIEYKSTFSDDELEDLVLKLDPSIDLASLSEQEKERMIPKSVYEDEKHMLEVIHSIVNKSRRKLGFQNGPGKTYNAVLTTSSIAQAQRYYDLFKKVVAEETPVTIHDKTKSVLPTFPRVAITYSISENEATSVNNQEKMAEAIKDYNEMFGTSFSIETMRAYNKNVNDRLARKQEKYLFRKEQLDLVIVVDRLLTGFDAPCLSTLFIDRAPMQPHDLIQAFSRTNRLFDRSKHFGQVVTFQTPALYTQKVKDALVLYSNGGENELLAPVFKEAHQAFKDALAGLRKIAPSPESVDALSLGQKKKYAKAFQEVDKAFAAIQVYTEYEEAELEKEYHVTVEEIEHYHGKYENVLEEIKPDPEEIDEPIDMDMEYELESVKTEDINYEYILQLIQALVPTYIESEMSSELESDSEEIDSYINDLKRTNPKLAELMEQLWKDIQEEPEQYRGKQVSSLLEEMIQEAIAYQVNRLSKEWAMKESVLTFYVNHYNPKKERQNGESELKRTSDYEAYKATTENPVKRLTYWREIKNAVEDMINETILPLRKP
ncbi:type I restriction-modification system restriction subunit [Carnobacterium sp. AT7]|uniref:type I restriction endonuclease subunit R n=1 Tax=Carnobacterium sp. AT7 TaxID=333990 RepID=UPI00015F2E06|nr:type I restriction endonuclease subunit R [Carnobacterium sp. AT7]EDP68172.1 type I restriction-modification system restriction subunit [Carnobacterium sp. AT7]